MWLEPPVCRFRPSRACSTKGRRRARHLAQGQGGHRRAGLHLQPGRQEHAQRRTGVIGLILPDLEDPFCIQVMKGIHHAIVALDYDLIAYTSGSIKVHPRPNGSSTTFLCSTAALPMHHPGHSGRQHRLHAGSPGGIDPKQSMPRLSDGDRHERRRRAGRDGVSDRPGAPAHRLHRRPARSSMRPRSGCKATRPR